MKFAMNCHPFGGWRLILTTSLTYLSILLISEVAGATLNVISPSPSNASTNSLLDINQSEGLEEGIENRLLAEILKLDELKCFPKLLCTIYQDKEVTSQGFLVNATELALAYIKLIRAVHYTSPTRGTTTEAPLRKKKPVIQIIKIPLGLITSSTYQGRRSPFKRYPHHHKHNHNFEADDYDNFQQDYSRYHSPRSPLPFHDDERYHHIDNDNDDNSDEDEDIDSFPYYGRGTISGTRDDADDDDEEREFFLEKVKMTQMMKNLREEDAAEMESPESGGLATTLLSSYLPFVGSSRSRREGRSHILTAGNVDHSKSKTTRESRRRKSNKKSQDPFWKAVAMWRKLKKRSQCNSMYKSCPMEAWEMVRMLDLVKGQSQVLATYLKITVDKVKPKPKSRRKSG